MFKIVIRGPEAGKIQKLADNIHGQIKAAVEKSMKDAEGISKRNFLSGPNYRGKRNPTPGPAGVLGWRTGHLKGSVSSRVIDGNPIQGVLSAGPLPYARIHEEGGDITRKSTAMGIGHGRVTPTMLAGHHTIRIPKRSYLEPALEAVRDRLKAAIEDIFERFGK